uniref:Uncharacterized protein n=1 Tax=Anguilla anguilla TaxID=7936 RepID=A0A0E9W8P8_ANGAN
MTFTREYELQVAMEIYRVLVPWCSASIQITDAYCISK